MDEVPLYLLSNRLSAGAQMARVGANLRQVVCSGAAGATGCPEGSYLRLIDFCVTQL